MTRLTALIFLLFGLSETSLSSWPACLKKSDFEEKTLQYAKNFRIWIHADGYLLSSKKPGADRANFYYLDRSNKKIPCIETISIPIKKTVLLSSTYIEYLNNLGAKNIISAVSSSSKIKRSDLLELGENPSIEKIWKLRPEVLFGYYFSSVDKKKFKNFEDKKIKYALVWDYLESSPLGRSEWLIFYGAFLDKINLSRKNFITIRNKYLRIRDRKRSNARVLLGEVYQDKWYSPGGNSSFARLVSDAGGEYIFSSNKDVKPIILSLESFLSKPKNKKIDFWVLNNSWKNKRDIIKLERRLGSMINLSSVLIFNSKDPKIFWDKVYPEVHKYLNDLNVIFSRKKEDLFWLREVYE